MIALVTIVLFIAGYAFGIDAYDIALSNSEELRNMASLRGIDTDLSDGEIRSALYELEGIEEYRIPAEDEEESYKVEILSTESLDSRGDIVSLEGGVKLQFVYDGEERTLTSDSVIIDTATKSISLIGKVDFPMGSEDEGSVESDIVTFYWERGDLFVEEASTLSERQNSEDKMVSVYSVGEKVTFLDGGTIIYDDGYIASSEKDPLSSINAGEIIMLPGSDMLISNATLNIGRVPVFYFPVFFYPGSTINGNPAFGFDSIRGAFLNTTWEIVGKSDLISDESDSSFLSIFEPTEAEDEGMVPSGPYYRSVELSPLEEKARRSGSFLAIMGDAYSDYGLHMGMSSKINLFDRKLKMSFLNGVGYTALENKDKDHGLRYYGENTIRYSDYGLDISASIPYYSDRYAKGELLTRNTRFSIDPLFGGDSKFDENSSSNSSFQRNLKLSYSLPSKYRTSLLSTFRLSSLDIVASYSYDYRKEEYKLDSMHLPTMALQLGGGYDTSMTISEKKAKQEEKKDEAMNGILSDPLLYPLYAGEEERRQQRSDSFRFAFDYNLNQKIDSNYDYRDGEKDRYSFLSTTDFNFGLNVDLSRYLTVDYEITPTDRYSYAEDIVNDRLVKENDFTLDSTLKADIPVLGISYRLRNNIYSISSRENDGEEKRDEKKPEFTKDSVREHSIALSRSFKTPIGTFYPKISYNIFPLTGALTPSFSYSYNDFSLALSWKFEDDGEGSFKSDDIAFSTAYKGKYAVFNLSSGYASSEYDEKDFWKPFTLKSDLTLRTSDSRYSITQSFNYKAYDKSTAERDVFNSIRTSIKIPYLTTSIDFSGKAGDIEFDRLTFRSDLKSMSFQAWKGRVYFDFGLKTELDLHISDIYSSVFSFEPSITFAIAEFMDIRFSFRTVNNNWGRYVDPVTDSFSFPLLWEDLARSFDFFGDGRMNTQFNLSSISLDFVHYMEDWDLHCKYSSSVVLSDAIYEFVPRLSIYLSWNTFPDLKVDQNWKKDKDGWKETGTK